MIELIVDGSAIAVAEGLTVLEACLDHGIYVPHLCFMKGMQSPPASCRLCFVEVAGVQQPVPSCKLKASDGMQVSTATPAVRRLQRAAFRLLRSVHRLDCKICPSNRKCVLQNLARFLSVPLKPKRLDHIVREPSSEPAHTLFHYDPGKCVLCGRCVFVCHRQNKTHALLTFAKRGFDTVISSFGVSDLEHPPCEKCRACVEICPVSAIFLKGTGDSQTSSAQ